MQKKIYAVLIVTILFIISGYKLYKYAPSQQADILKIKTQTNSSDVPITQIKVYKSARYLDLMSQDQVVHRYTIRLGFNPEGAKRIEGDGKTPEGIYHIDWRNPQSKFYKSLHISYPNAQDIAFAKQHHQTSAGSNIMIHGSSPVQGEPDQALYHYMPQHDWTLGCIAVSNAAMDEIWQHVQNGVVIEILP